MNERRREQLRSVVVKLERARSIVDAVCDKEQDCMDNYPENLQYTERFERTETAVDSLNDALEKLEEAQEHIQNAISQ